MNLDYIKLENDREYAVIDTLIQNDNRYLYLASEDDEKDIAIRKVVTGEGKEYLTKLDNNEEFDNVMKGFLNKHGKDKNNES